LEQYIFELELYRSDKDMYPLEEDVLVQAKRWWSIAKGDEEVIEVWNDDSTEAAIRRNEFDYNGDAFESMGYKMYTDEGRWY